MATFTEKLKALFIDTLRETCNVTVAAQTVGINSGTAYRHRKEDPIFAEQWDEALQEGIDLLEAEAHRRAFSGVEELVFHQGMPTIVYKRDEKGDLLFRDISYVDDKGETQIRKEPIPEIDPKTGRVRYHAVRKYSDGLTQFLLKAHRPDKYRERSEVKQEVTGGLQLNDTARAARLAALLDLAKSRKGGNTDDTSDLI